MKPGQARVGYGWGVGEFGAPLKSKRERLEEVFLGEVHDQFVLVSFHDDVCYHFQYISIPFFADHDVFGAGAFNWINFQQKISQLFDHGNSVFRGTRVKMNLNRWSLFTTWSNIHESNQSGNWSNMPLLVIYLIFLPAQSNKHWVLSYYYPYDPWTTMSLHDNWSDTRFKEKHFSV